MFRSSRSKAAQQARKARQARRQNRVRPQVEQLEDRLAPAVFVVNTTQDIAGPPSNGLLSLRQAIDAVNASTDVNNTIILSSGTYGISVLSTTEDNNSGGDFDIGQVNGTPITHALNLTIQGQGPNSTVITGNQLDRVFQIFGTNSGVNVTFNDLEITGGLVNGKGGGIYLNDTGNTVGANSVTLNDVLLTKNTASSDGGGIYTGTGNVTLNGSIVSANTADGFGGGIYTNNGNISVAGSAVSGNTADSAGAASTTTAPPPRPR
jgi:predicted outer membrane repeat protein